MSRPIAIFDTHCHYNLEPIFPDWHGAWETAQSAGVVAGLVIGVNEQSSERAVQIAAAQPNLLAAVGIHPTEAGEREALITEEYLTQFLDTMLSIGPVAAIGETGLDYFRLTGTQSERAAIIAKQKAALTTHLAVASQRHLPVSIHVRDRDETAYKDVIELITPFADLTPIILHCFSGSDWYLDEALAQNCSISFAGNITYPSAQLLRKHASRVPADKILVETDAPYLPPQTHRGQTNQPVFIAETVAFLERELSIAPEQLLTNARRIFTTIHST